MSDCEICKVLKKRLSVTKKALAFYGEKDTYFAIGFLPDRPCGAFVDDFDLVWEDDGDFGYRPGKKARMVLIRDEEKHGTPRMKKLAQAALKGLDELRAEARQSARKRRGKKP